MFGAGKPIAQDGKDSIVVEYFDNPGQPPEERYRETVPRATLKRFPLNSETRVFWEVDGVWRSGRILYTTDNRDICVRGHEWEGFVDESEISVRWQHALTDPVGFGLVGLLESPLLADRRRPFLQALLRQRAAAHGMSGVMSSSVEIHAHQVEVVRRVLEDPVQRYLLADEVGLGKTIEAGLIIRQLLLDNPTLEIQFILPPFLMTQWMRELEAKFQIHTFKKAVLRFSRDDRPEEWQRADLIVVDEAHNLARLAGTDNGMASRYERLRDVALASPRLLLLSATPVLHNEDVFLAMLRLLDPQVYGESDVDALRARVEARGSLGRILLGMHAHLPAVLLRNRLSDVTTLFPEDLDVQALVAAAQEALDTTNVDNVDEALRNLRVHVSEVYRLHRRMLRTRRTADVTTTYRVTGRRSPVLQPRDAGVAGRIDLLVDGWRQELLAEAEATDGSLDEAAGALAIVCELAHDPPSLKTWALHRAEHMPHGAQAEALQRMARGVGRINRREEIAQPVADALTYELAEKERMVIFCPTTEMAVDLTSELRDLVGNAVVATHLLTDDADVAEASVQDLEDPSGTSRLLVCDSSAEEGRNLQFADVLVHLGVPSAANHLEQRIGRLDRWSQGKTGDAWRSIVISDPDGADTLVAAWHRVLDEGFGVFDRSIASLQHAVEVATTEAWRTLLTAGAAGAGDAAHQVRERLGDELERIREQDALDAIEAVHDERSVFAAIQRVEADEPSFARDTDQLMADRGEPGNLRFQRTGSPVHEVGAYRVRGQGYRGGPLFPLLPTWRILRDFVSLEGHEGTFCREVSVRRPGLQLYRYGAPLIDSVADFLRHDDRGRAFGMWRWIPGWDRPERPAYRFDYHVEARSDSWKAALAREVNSLGEGAMQRRSDALFPPVIVSLWLDDRFQLIEDDEVLAALERPYRKPRIPEDPAGGDFRLNSKRIAWAYELVAKEQWGEVWRGAEAEAERLVQTHPSVVDSIVKSTVQARLLLGGRLHQMRLRARRASDDERRSLGREIAFEEELAGAIQEAIAKPRLQLDSTGVVIVSGDVPMLERQA